MEYSLAQKIGVDKLFDTAKLTKERIDKNDGNVEAVYSFLQEIANQAQWLQATMVRDGLVMGTQTQQAENQNTGPKR